jgi:hypothetical protein
MAAVTWAAISRLAALSPPQSCRTGRPASPGPGQARAIRAASVWWLAGQRPGRLQRQHQPGQPLVGVR